MYQDSKTAGWQIHIICLYMSNCQHDDLPLIQGLSYIWYCIYNDLYGYKEVLACIRSAGIMSSGRQVDMYTLIYINGYLPSCRPADRAYHV